MVMDEDDGESTTVPLQHVNVDSENISRISNNVSNQYENIVDTQQSTNASSLSFLSLSRISTDKGVINLQAYARFNKKDANFCFLPDNV